MTSGDRQNTTRAAADAVAEALRAQGSTALFGVPGGGANLDMVGAAEDAGIDFVLAHDESAACVMAATHGLLTSSVGAAVVTRGPGLTNAATGLAQATLDRFPLLLVSDMVSQASSARVPHQRLDQQALAASMSKWSGILGTEDQTGLARAAAALAAGSPAGGVHLALDVTTAGDNAPVVPAAEPVHAEALAEAEKLVAASRRPVVLAGLEAARDPAVAAQLDRLGCPVLCTYQGKGTVPDTSPRSGGLFTNGAIERSLVERSDLILAVGLDPVELIPAPWRYEAPVVLLHPAPVEPAYFGDPLVVLGPLGETLAALSADHDWEPDAGAQARKAALAALEYEGEGLTPHQVVRAVAQAAPAGHLATVDAGAHMLVAMPLWEASEPNQVLISNGLATMGFALPAAIGAALARPQRPVVCFVGDGGLGMTLAELETVARLNLNLTVVVFNDAALSLIEIKQKTGQGGVNSVRYQPSDFAELARGMGVPGCTVDDAAGLRAELAGGLAGPKLIDARIDPACYPHVIGVTRG